MQKKEYDNNEKDRMETNHNKEEKLLNMQNEIKLL